MNRAKALSMILLTVAIIFFAGQNLDSVEVTFLFWTFYVSLSLITLVALLVGLLVGWIGTAVIVRRRDWKDRPKATAVPESDELPQPSEVPAAAIKDEEEIPR